MGGWLVWEIAVTVRLRLSCYQVIYLFRSSLSLPCQWSMIIQITKMASSTRNLKIKQELYWLLAVVHYLNISKLFLLWALNLRKFNLRIANHYTSSSWLRHWYFAFSLLMIIPIIRAFHSSWASPSGIILIGGQYSGTTSEKIQEEGTSSYNFDLEYNTA